VFCPIWSLLLAVYVMRASEQVAALQLRITCDEPVEALSGRAAIHGTGDLARPAAGQWLVELLRYAVVIARSAGPFH
jgi:hypothetical protein